MLISQETPVKKAWVTLLTNSAYFPGLIVLYHSLLKTGTQYPLYVIHPPDLDQQIVDLLDEWKIGRICLPHLVPPHGKEFADDPRFQDVWSKLLVFSLTSFETAILIDNDMLVRKNMDELMDIELDPVSMDGKGDRVFAATHACVCNPFKKPQYPKNWVPENCAYRAQHNDPDAAQKTGMPSSFGLSLLNSGLLVVKPSEATFNQICEKLDTPEVAHYIFPDQDLLAEVFHQRWVSLPYIYNALRPLKETGIHEPIWRDEEVRNVHYIISPKPWDPEPPRSVLTKWWRDLWAEIDPRYKVLAAAHLKREYVLDL